MQVIALYVPWGTVPSCHTVQCPRVPHLRARADRTVQPRPGPLRLFLFTEKFPLEAVTTSTQHDQSVTATMSETRADAAQDYEGTSPHVTAPTSSVDEAVISSIRASWEVAKPDRPQFTEVVQLLASLREDGNGRIFKRGPHVQASHFGFFKPEVDSFYEALQRKDRRSAKAWEYINAAGAWADMANTAIIIAKSEKATPETFVARLALAEKALQACREVLAMRADLFKDVTEHGLGLAKGYAKSAEQTADVSFSATHRSIRDAVAARVEIETARILARAHVGSSVAFSSNRKKDGEDSE